MTLQNAAFTVAPAGYRLPAALELGPVTLQVADLDRSLAYYERVIGLHAIARADTSATLAAHGSSRPLVHLQAKAGAAPVPPRGRLGLYHFAILLPTRAHLGQFVRHLAELGEYAGMSDHLVSEAVYLTDPDGLGIEVYADRPRAGWKLKGDAIAMATDPLDVAGLIEAAGSAPWAGAPADTRIGHVHLYVSSLEQSAAFFHAALGLDRVTLEFPGALFLSAGGYHHHLGTNTWAQRAPVATDGDARLLEWTLMVPAADDVRAAAGSLQAAGNVVVWDGEAALATDPWGTRLRIAPTA